MNKDSFGQSSTFNPKTLLRFRATERWNNMRILVILLICLLSQSAQSFARSQITEEQAKLLKIKLALSYYMRDSGGRVPTTLAPLRDYLDLPAIFRTENDPNGPFTERYAFLPSQPRLESPKGGARQLLLLSVKPFSDGKRRAIWRYADGEYHAATIDEDELQAGIRDFDLTALKPMGGDIPPSTKRVPEAELTEYQARVMQLVRQGKITPQPRGVERDPANGTGPSSGAAAENTSIRTAPHPVELGYATPAPKIAAPERRTTVWSWFIVSLLLILIAWLVRKRFY